MTEATAGLRVVLKATVGTLDLDVAIEVKRGCVVLVGPNGAGKSTLLSLLVGAIRPSCGLIQLDAATLVDVERGRFTPVECRRFGFVPQSSALLPNETVREHIEFGLRCDGLRNSQAQRRRQLDALLEQFALTALAGRRAWMLSGGEMQRLALARTIAARPRVLLLDEPLSALDAGARSEVRLLLASHLKAIRIPTIIVTHDADDARVLGQSIAVMESGRITQVGNWQELVARPATQFVKQFVSGEERLRSVDTSTTPRRYLSAI
jgi:molybdate transport system ATP-binding protein